MDAKRLDDAAALGSLAEQRLREYEDAFGRQETLNEEIVMAEEDVWAAQEEYDDAVWEMENVNSNAEW